MTRASLRTVVVHRHAGTRERLAALARDRGHDVESGASLADVRGAVPSAELLVLEWTGGAPLDRAACSVVVAVLEPLTPGSAAGALHAGADDCIDAGEAPTNVVVRLAWAERQLEKLRDRASVGEDLRRLYKAVETMQVGVTITDLNGRIVYANPAEAEMHGYTVSDYVGQPGRALSPRVDWRPLSPEQLRGMRKWRRERVRQRRDGTTFPVRLMSDVVTDAAGVPVGIVTVCEDITERRRAEEAEAATRERHRRFFEEDLAGAAILAPDGTIRACNPAFARMVGEPSPDAVTGRELASFLRDPTAARLLVPSLGAEGRVQHYGLELARADAVGIVVLASFVGVFDEAGILLEVNSYFVDVTEHRRLEEQLRQSQKMEAIGKLAGGVAHDFNNLLMVVLGFADQLLAQLPEDDPRRRCVEPIAKAAEKGAVLTRQLLAVSRRDPVQPRVLDLNGIVRDMDRMLERLIGSNIECRSVVSDAPCPVRLDPGHAEQVLLNLVVNARDAMPRGGRLTIETRHATVDDREARRVADLHPGAYVLLVVSDTGVGMPPEVLSHVFEPFFTTKVAGQGTGFGLATVYGIVKQAGGSIAIHSEAGRGTSFHIYLPAASGPIEVVGATATPGQTPVERTVLLVEDQEDARELVRGYLAAVGYRVLEAGHPREALELLARHPETQVDLLLADVIMPTMSGPELARALRARSPGTRVLFMSGADGVTDADGRPDPTVSVLQKPFRAGELQARVHEVLAR